MPAPGQRPLDAAAACQLLGAATQSWPDAAGMRGHRRRPTTREQRRDQVRAAQKRRDARRATKRDAARAEHATHHWVKVGSHMRRCAHCLQAESANPGRCDGRPPHWQQVQLKAQEEGHQLREGLLYDLPELERAECAARQRGVHKGFSGAHAVGIPMLLCMGCGAYTTGGRLQTLVKACHAPTAAGKVVLDPVQRE